MKKLLGLLCFAVLFMAANCENEPLEGEFLTEAEVACLEAIDATATAQANFDVASTEDALALCSVLKTALETQIEACGDANGFLQSRIDNLGDCTVTEEPQTCEEAQQASSEAKTDLDEATSENYMTLCMDYKVALENEIMVCGDEDGSLQMMIDELGNCENNNEPDPVVEISVTGGTLLTEFDLVDVVTEGDILRVTGLTSTDANNYMIYFEVMMGETGVDIINSTFVITYASDFFPSTQGFEDFTSEITENTAGVLKGTFFGTVTNADNADLSLTSGMIDIDY